MNELQIFKNEQFGEVRVIEKDGQPWFVATDICSALEISNVTVTLQRLDDDERSKLNLGRQGEANTINEYGLYNLVLASRKPEAKQFKRWVTHEVIPSIRKTGGFVNNDDLFINTYLPNADDQTKLMFKSQLSVIKSLNNKIEQDKPKVLFAEAMKVSKNSILVGELAKLLKQNDVHIGQNRLFQWMRDNNYLISRGESWNMPTQYSMEMGLFEIKVTTINNPDGSVRETKTPKVTGKGQVYFVNKLLKEKEEINNEDKP
jgi:anti-repressor protein